MATLLIAEHDNKILNEANKKPWVQLPKLVKRYTF
jgi:hypothetical protein